MWRVDVDDVFEYESFHGAHEYESQQKFGDAETVRLLARFVATDRRLLAFREESLERF
jgi:hypothetical protein